MNQLKQLGVGLILALLATTMVSGVAFAAAGESISSFDSQIIASQDGSVAVTETIDYNFGLGQRHGIFRYIPYKYTDDQGQHFQTIIKVTQVTQDGLKVPAAKNNDSGNQVIKIGDPNKTISGRHRYVIAYQLKPLLMNQTDGDLLRFNVTGNGWDVPINSVVVTVTSPGLNQTAAACYTGVTGSRDKNCTTTLVEGGYQISTSRPLDSGEGMTIDVAWKSGSFAAYARPGQIQLSFLQILTIILSCLGLILLLIALLRLGLRKLGERRLKRSQTVIAQYEPPDGLGPAELGFLSDDKVDLIEVTATLVDLAVRGYLKITQTSPRRFAGLSPAQYSFTKLKDGTGLEPFESKIFSALFTGTVESVDLSNVNRSSMSQAVTEFKSNLETRLKTKGYYQSPPKAKLAWLKGGLLVGLLFLFAYTGLILIGPILLAAGLLANYLVSRQRRSTLLGAQEWAKIEGFKLFLKVTESDRLKFTDAPAKTPALFSKLLPYAIALKVEKDWAKQFKNIDLAPSAGSWYYANGNSSYNPIFLTNDLSSGFATAVATNFAPANTSSSGFGGGFSGGGGGGGGGGSW